MATPKKKISKSRRNMRRFSPVYVLKAETTVTSPLTGEPTRPHRVTRETVSAYVAEKKKRKEARKAGASKSASK